MKSKKLISMLLVTSMCATAALAGCGSTDADSSKTSSSESSSTVEKESSVAESEKAEEKVEEKDMPTISYFLPCDPQDDQDMVEQKLNELTMDKIGVKVDLQFIDWASWKDKTKLMHSSNEYFDVMCGYQQGNTRSIVDNGIALSISELLQTEGADLYAALPDYMWSAATVDGEIYFVPNYQIEIVGSCVALRKDLVEKYNYDYSKVDSADDIEDFWKLVLENDPGLIPLRNWAGLETFWRDGFLEVDGVEHPGAFTLYSGIVPLDWDSKQPVDVPIYCTDYFKGVAKEIVRWMEEGYLRSDLAAVDGAMEKSDWIAGKYASGFLGSYKPGMETELKNESGYDWILIPCGEGLITETWPMATSTFISAGTKYPEESMRFVELINTDAEVYNLLCYGIEGEHYQWADEEHVQIDTGAGYNPGFAWAVGNQFNAYVQVGQDADVWEQTIALNETGIASPFMGIVWSTSDVTLEKTQVAKVRDTYVASINCGIGDPDTYWDQMLKEFEDAGYNVLYEEAKKQAEAFFNGLE